MAPAKTEPTVVPETPAVTPGPSPTTLANEAAQVTLGAARSKIEAKLYDQGISDLRGIIAQRPASPAALESYFLIARAYELQNKPEDAMATYLEVRSRYPSDPRAAEAAYKYASLTLTSKRRDKEREARKLFSDVATAYPDSAPAIQALVAKARLEERERMKEPDVALKATVPSALITYRLITERYPSSTASEGSLWKLSEMYEELKRYDLSVQALADLATRFPNTKLETAFRTGELYERRIKDRAKAREAYAQVPANSPQYKRAQEKLNDLAGR
jgi:TolA-binding protein